MALINKEDLLAFAVKIPREIHDEIDAVRALAKSVNATYDPHKAVVKALKRDLAVTRKQIEDLANTNAAKGGD
jgi:hypothetical protein